MTIMILTRNQRWILIALTAWIARKDIMSVTSGALKFALLFAAIISIVWQYRNLKKGK